MLNTELSMEVYRFRSMSRNHFNSIELNKLKKENKELSLRLDEMGKYWAKLTAFRCEVQKELNYLSKP